MLLFILLSNDRTIFTFLLVITKPLRLERRLRLRLRWQCTDKLTMKPFETEMTRIFFCSVFFLNSCHLFFVNFTATRHLKLTSSHMNRSRETICMQVLWYAGKMYLNSSGISFKMLLKWPQKKIAVVS